MSLTVFLTWHGRPGWYHMTALLVSRRNWRAHAHVFLVSTSILSFMVIWRHSPLTWYNFIVLKLSKAEESAFLYRLRFPFPNMWYLFFYVAFKSILQLFFLPVLSDTMLITLTVAHLLAPEIIMVNHREAGEGHCNVCPTWPCGMFESSVPLPNNKLCPPHTHTHSENLKCIQDYARTCVWKYFHFTPHSRDQVWNKRESNIL